MPLRPARQARVSRITAEERNQREQNSGIARNPKYPNLLAPKKGERPEGAGRKPGQKNRVTRIVKELLLDSLDESGFDGNGKGGAVGYLVWLSRKEPVAYAALIARVMPMQLQLSGNVNHEGTVEHRMTASELEAKLKERGLPVPKIIDHDPAEFLDVESGGTREDNE